MTASLLPRCLLLALLIACPVLAEDALPRREGLVQGGGGKSFTLLGHPVAVGEQAPAFTLPDAQNQPVSLADYAGKVVILTAFPSVDTRVCATQTRTFNQRAAAIPEVQVLTLSADLPFALERFCAAEGIDRVRTLSDHKDMQFGRGYGFQIEELRLLARGTVIVDKAGVVRYVEIVPELGREPDYDKAIAVATELAKAP
jgi:thiol peroxidase